MITGGDALFATRVAAGVSGAIHRFARLHPTACAFASWIVWMLARAFHAALASMGPIVREVRFEGQVLATNTYDTAGLAGVAAATAWWALLAAGFFTIAAIVVVVESIVSGWRPSVRRSRRGPIAATLGAADVYDRHRERANRDAKKLGKTLRRVTGRAGADMPKSNETKQGKKARKAAKRIGKATERREAVEDESEWAVEMARANGTRARDAQTLIRGEPRSGIDPAAPPVAPGSSAGNGPLMREWRARSEAVAAETRRFLAEIHGGHPEGYEPPAAPARNGSGS